ncbi:hypothetical protein DEU56DRAFT_126715 [Suillus clintonianus]|uniref:uncharacterized protein n=1 Tax=Suillus clintonianus TaxID=1904413 RepID=UPI001B880808|nr:uncharacterized protein DEU56DRAFT_126715 [Suillus clintonianus]KAG2147515.1 hypothetical protein DEU56DRAFT_126715 [Suillus clintonianus]
MITDLQNLWEALSCVFDNRTYIIRWEVADLQISKYTNIGGLAILIFDFCITFQDEVHWTWSRPWGSTRVIFTISRYLPFAGAGMTAYAALRVSGPCPPSLAENIIHIISIVAAEGLLIIRTWALWEKSKRMLIGLLTYSAATVIAAVAVNVSPNHQLIPGGMSTTPGCAFESSRNSAVVYAILAGFECVILSLTAYKWFHDYRKLQSSIVATAYGGSMLYVLCIITITVTNVIIDAELPFGYSNMFDTLQLVIHSVLASRILFHLRSSEVRAHDTNIPLLAPAVSYGQPSQMQTNEMRSEAIEI